MRPWIVQLAVVVAALSMACAAPRQMGGVVIVPGATERLLLAMRLGYGGTGELKPPARVRRVAQRDDLPAGAATAGRVGDWLLENGSVTAVIADVDRGPRGGCLLDLGRGASRVDELSGVETVVSGGRVRYESVKTGTDDLTGTAYVQVTGRSERHPLVEVVTRYDLARDLEAVVIHSSLTLGGRTLDGLVAVGDAVSFPESSARVVVGPGDVAGFGRSTSYALEPLAGEVTVAATSASGASIGLAPEQMVTEESDPFIYSRVLAFLDRPDDVALAVARARVAGHAVGEVELEVEPLPRKPGSIVPGGIFRFHRVGAPAPPLELPIRASLRAGDRHFVQLPVGPYLVGFEGPGFRSVGTETVHVASRVRTPVRLRARLAPAMPPASVRASE